MQSETHTESKKNTPLKAGYFVTALSVFAFVALVKIFLLDIVRVSSGSMEPGLLIGDGIVVNKAAYGLFGAGDSGPEKGEIIAFELGGRKLVKRVIAGPGDRVEYDGNNNIFVNGRPLRTNNDNNHDSLLSRQPVSIYIPERSGRYFVAGDNIWDSRDSRDFGLVKRSMITGEPFLIYFSSGKEGVRWRRIFRAAD